VTGLASSPARGQLITIEGPEGSGKTTQAARLEAFLVERGVPVVGTREPGGTVLGERIRDLLLDPGASRIDPLADAFLFNAARHQLVAEVIEPALAAGTTVVCARFADSTRAYQGYGSGLDLAMLRDLEASATDGLRPDLVILLDVPVPVGLARRGRGDPSALTRFEDEARHNAAFHERVRAGYLELARADRWRWWVTAATRAPDEVEEDVAAAALEFLGANEPTNRLARIRG